MLSTRSECCGTATAASLGSDDSLVVGDDESGDATVADTADTQICCGGDSCGDAVAIWSSTTTSTSPAPC